MFLDTNRIGDDGLRLERDLELPELEGESGGRLAVAPVRMELDCRRGRLGIELRGRLRTRVRLECSRCLESYETPLEGDFFLVAVPPAVEYGPQEARLEREDTCVLYCEEGKVDLARVAGEQVVLALPLKPVCQEGCRGLCATCGANRNRLECGCQREVVDPRLAPLLDWKPKNRRG